MKYRHDIALRSIVSMLKHDHLVDVDPFPEHKESPFPGLDNPALFAAPAGSDDSGFIGSIRF